MLFEYDLPPKLSAKVPDATADTAAQRVVAVAAVEGVCTLVAVDDVVAAERH